LVPSQTELLFDLGLEHEIVGITKFCVHPFYAKQTKTIVGGTKKIKLNKIKELKPDIILCNREENTLDIVEQCSEICQTHVSDIYSLEDAKELIASYGMIFNKRIEATHIVQKLDFKLRDFQSYIENKKILKVAYFIWRNPWMVAANHTFIDHLLTLNKYENIYGDRERYPEIELKKIRLEGDPELIFLSSEPYPFKDEHAFEVGRFAHHAKTVFVDGELFSWYGSRLLQSFDYFKKLRSRLE
jgi:ABC-type Fe3+-hydroxamate transport system substrate-binding protein